MYNIWQAWVIIIEALSIHSQLFEQDSEYWPGMNCIGHAYNVSIDPYMLHREYWYDI